MHHIEQPTSHNLTRRWLFPALIGVIALLTGCASSTSDEKSQAAWLGSQQTRLSQGAGDVTALDPITIIAASQHPLSRQALQQLGVRYRYGGTSPESGFDCSGLIHYSAKESLGLKLPRRSSDIARSGTSIKRPEIAAGDLVFFNTRGARFSHVGIYLGSDLFVHAPSSGGTVRVANMNEPYWNKRFNGARRINPVMIANR